MSRTSADLDATFDDEPYNRLRRPDELLAPTPPAIPPSPPSKRTFDEAIIGDGDGDEDEGPSSKRPKEDQLHGYTMSRRTRAAANPMHMETGMKSMFPGMMDADDFDEDTSEALSYLRSVRSEAQTIPALLVADNTPSENDAREHSTDYDGYDDTSVIYEDGTFIARDRVPEDRSSQSLSDDPTEPSPQEQYFKALLHRYKSLRRKFADGSRENLKARMTSHPSNCTMPDVPKSRHGWLYTLDRIYPTPAQIYMMDEHDVFQGLKYCAHSLDRLGAISKQKSCWIWALLARAPEYGTLDYTRVGYIRDLGHRAGQFRLKLPSNLQRQMDEAQDMDIDAANDEVNEVGQPATDVTPESKTKVENAGLNAEKSNDLDDQSSGEMSMSEDGEVANPDEPKTLEEARARLLAQLGDRLVRDEDTDTGAANRPSNTGSQPRPHPPFASRAEAEKYRAQSSTGSKEKYTNSDAASKEQNTISDTTSREIRTTGDAARKDKHTTTASSDKQETPDGLDDVESAAWNCKVTIDMILTVVCECYGQKDLLRFRGAWADY